MSPETVVVTKQNPLWATGRRKTAVARVRMVPGEGRLVVNSKSLDDFFQGHERHKVTVLSPLKLKPVSNYDIYINTSGGGVTGQAEAIRLGLSRALSALEPELRPVFRKKGFLTRDPRMVERKKAGQPKARKRYQHSKR